MLGSIKNDSLSPFYIESNAFILPCLATDLNNADGLPVVFQEALFSGTPVYCREAFGVSELIINNINGYAFLESSDEFFWANKIIDINSKIDFKLINKIAVNQCKK